MTAAYRMTALLSEIVPVEDPDRQIFNLMLQTWRQLDRRKNIQSMSAAFQLQLLQLSGFFPQFEECAACGGAISHAPKGSPVFYQRNLHRFTCGRAKCVPGGGSLKISAGSFEIIRKFRNTAIDRAHTLRLSRTQSNEVDILLKQMFEYILERKPRIMDVVERLVI